ncbi:MAG: AraC family transcriptional regulator [Planctomycetes bacterium]|nr:AraC family transcriptional regulator [Planctomycetota bacterium]
MNFFQYLPVTDRDIQWGIYVTGAGHTCVPPHVTYPLAPHPEKYNFLWQGGRVLSEYQIIYITRGGGDFESAKAGKGKITAGNIILLFPGEWHRYRPSKKTGWDEYWVACNGESMDHLCKHTFISPETPVLKTGQSAMIQSSYQKLLDLVRSESIGYQQLIASGTLEILAATLATVRGQQNDSSTEALVSQAIVLLKQRTEELVSMEKLAASLNLSPTHFHRIFKQQTGVPPYQYHLQLRLSRAKDLLRTTNLPIKKISAMLGFDNPYHFSKIFKQKTGVSPTQWRGIGQ